MNERTTMKDNAEVTSVTNTQVIEGELTITDSSTAGITASLPVPVPEGKRVSIRYNTAGTVIKAHIKDALYRAMLDVKSMMADATDRDFSQSILVRRALDLYLRKAQRMSPEDLKTEALHLAATYR